MDQASLLLPNFAFMFDKKSLLKIKKLMITPERALTRHSGSYSLKIYIY